MIPEYLQVRDIRSHSAASFSSNLSIALDVALLETDLLLLHALIKDGFFSISDSRASLLGILNEVLAPTTHKIFNEFYNRRISGEPIEYIINKKNFYGYDYYVDSRVLIPRSDTELLVTTFIKLFEETRPESISLIDVGTGSSAILCSCLLELRAKGELKKVESAIGIDISEDALKVAELNIKQFDLTDNIYLCHGTLLSGIDFSKYQSELLVILSNPPYLDIKDRNICDRVIQFEPKVSLFSADNGFKHLETLIIEFTEAYLRYPQFLKSAHLIIEIGHNQANRLKTFAQNWSFLGMEIGRDLSGLNRMLHFFIS